MYSTGHHTLTWKAAQAMVTEQVRIVLLGTSTLYHTLEVPALDLRLAYNSMVHLATRCRNIWDLQ